MIDRNQSAFPAAPKLLNAAPKLRQPVSLEVPVRLQGEPNGHDTFFEDTQTVLVFNEGAVLRVGGEVLPGQTLLLTNRATRQQAPCRVAYVKHQGTVRGYAEVEFSAPVPGFWDDKPRFEPSLAPVSVAPVSRQAIPSAPAAALRIVETFAPVDNIADPVVASYSRPMPKAIVLPDIEPPLPPPATSAAPVEPPAPVTPAVDEIEQMLAQKREETGRAANESAQAANAFVAKLADPAGQVAFAAPQRKSRKRWMFVAMAGAALLTIGTSVGSWGLQAEIARIVPPAPAVPEPPEWAISNLFEPVPSISGLPLRTAHNREILSMTMPVSIRRAKEMQRTLLHAAAATPTLAPRVAADSAAPEISAPSPAGGTSLTLLPTGPANVAAPVAPAESKLEPLRLISSARPYYPAIARQNRTQGDVLIHAHVDETGKVAQMNVISGPHALRQAALDALSQWKYAPAKLNGKPVAVDTVVTIKFQL